MTDLEDLIALLHKGDRRALARCISLVENESIGWQNILQSLHSQNDTPIIGLTGPPGAGKSSLLNVMVRQLLHDGKKVGVLAVDPSSPFNLGSLLGDRVRMSEHFVHPNLFIRSMATRGSLGGLSKKIYETTDLLKTAGFDYIFIETVGVGQSEVEIAGLADTTVLVLVPEAGDEIQTIKSGIMEIADVYVVNKADRPGADIFFKNLNALIHENEKQASVHKTVATSEEGISQLLDAIGTDLSLEKTNGRRSHLLLEKALSIIRYEKMKDFPIEKLREELKEKMNQKEFNLYSFVQHFAKSL